MINLRTDSDGNTYNVWVQEQVMSCSIASMWMARCIVHQMSFAESEWELAVRFYRAAVGSALAPLGVNPDAPVCFAAGQPGGTMGARLATDGFSGDEIVRALRKDGLTVMARSRGAGPMVIDPTKIAPTKPALIGVRWANGGGHIIVAASINQQGQIVYLDPSGGDLTEQGNMGAYTAPNGAFGQLDLALYLSTH